MFKNIYYYLRPMSPRWIQIRLRQYCIQRRRDKYSDIWPIDEKATFQSESMDVWPKHKKFALILTHDVEKREGLEKCWPLIELEEKLGFRSSFYFVPEMYRVSSELMRHLDSKGFEVGVHGLKHDGKLYKSKKIFKERAVKINKYLKEWNAQGFRSPAMHHNLEWIHYLNIEYDASTFDTDPFEPQPDGVGTIFPFWVNGKFPTEGYVELPYTLPQDHTLFIIMKERDISIWKKKLNWIVDKKGMVLLNTHPDYMNFQNGKLRIEEYPAHYYEKLLLWIKENYEGQYWHVLPKEMADFCKSAIKLK